MKRNFKRNFMQNGSNGGSLLNEPSSNMQDLDRELELLRRKRKLLESQQYEGTFGRPNPWDLAPRVNEYVAPSRSFGQTPYAGLYDSQRQSNWQEPAVKRFRQPEYDSRPAPRPFQGQRPQHFAPPNTYSQPGNFAGPKRAKGFVNNKPGFVNPRPGFVNNKPGFVNNKPGFANPRPGFVNPKRDFSNPKSTPRSLGYKQHLTPKPAAATATTGRPGAPGDSRLRFLDYVITDTAEPFPSVVKGRLEAVLGDVYRGIKARTAEIPLDQSRFVKQVLRERIRKAMLGKKLGSSANVLGQYLKAHPSPDDEVVLRIAKQNQAKAEAKTREEGQGEPEEENPFLKNLVPAAGSPELYFKENIEIVISNKLNEVFQRLQKIYDEENHDSLECLIQEVDQIASEQEPEKADETANGDVVKKENGAENGEKAAANDAPVSIKTEDEAAEKTPADAGDADKAVTTREEYYSKLMQALINRELPILLPSFKNDMVKLLSADVKYAQAQGMIAKQAVAVPKFQKKAVCYVMILGDPALPRKERLQVFLNKHHPASIKRHRRVRNVLYIGFADKQDFDNIIAQDGLVLSNMKLSIKESLSCRENHFTIQKGVAKLIVPAAEATTTAEANISADNTSADNTEIPSADKTETGDDQSLIDSDLDGQINDLLCSIDNSSGDVNLDDGTENEASETAEAGDNVTEATEATETADDNNGVDEATNDEGDANGTEDATEVTAEAKDSCEVVKTPTRASNRLAGGIKTRRASRLAQ